jgi:hypothetical protein
MDARTDSRPSFETHRYAMLLRMGLMIDLPPRHVSSV